MAKHRSDIDWKGEIWYLVRTETEFRLEAKERFVAGMTDPRELWGGSTFAEDRRAELHKLLDEWINEALQK